MTRGSLVCLAGLCLLLVSGVGCSTDAARSASPPDGAVVEDPLEVAAATIRGPDLAAHIEILASDAFEGRFPATAGETKTVGYVAAELAARGVQPAVGGRFTQEVPLRRTTVSPASSIEVRGRGEVLRWGEDVLMGTKWGEPRVRLEDREVVFAGYGVVAPEYGWDDYGGVDVNGKVVVVLAGDPPAPDGMFEGRALTHHGTSAGKAETAARLGADAVLQIRADGAGGVSWKTLATGARAPSHALAARSKTKPRVQGLLARDAATRLLRGSSHDLERMEVRAGSSSFVAIPLGVRVDLKLDATVEDRVSHNVVGMIPGRLRPNEVVLYTAHWDHVGVRPDLEGDTVFNGAVDNATGTAALVELAEAYGALPRAPERTVVFAAMTAEEQGLLGSSYYAEHPIFPLRDTIAVINMDALFPFGAFDSMTVVAMGSSDLDGFLETAAAAVGRTLHPDPMPELGAFFRSDHYPFAARGVPAMFAVGGPSPERTAPDSPVAARFQDYVTHRYHQPADEYDPETWDMEGIRQDVEVFFRMGMALADSDASPNWRPDHAFRARRDAMLEGR